MKLLKSKLDNYSLKKNFLRKAMSFRRKLFFMQYYLSFCHFLDDRRVWIIQLRFEQFHICLLILQVESNQNTLNEYLKKLDYLYDDIIVFVLPNEKYMHKKYQSVFVGRSLLNESISRKRPLSTHSVASVL